jgi:DNA-binding transcriptional ArsR family regulator
VGSAPVRAGLRRRAVPGLGEHGDVGAVFAALADPTRRAVLRSLAERPGLTASRLAGELPMTRQAVAKHLGALSGAGLVEARREGRETRYTLTPAPLADAIEWMTEVGAEWDARLARLARRAKPGFDGHGGPAS